MEEVTMQNILMTIGIIVTAVTVTVTLAAVVLVSLASVHEESAQSLSGQAPGLTARTARQLLGFRTESSTRPAAERVAAERVAAERVARAASQTQLPMPDVRFPHARRTLPDFGQHAARRQPQPSTVFADRRQGAGV
jgi:hypothetical protein